MTLYNKLVRDKIPEIIRENGQNCRTRLLGEEEYKLELRRKLGEELNEYREARDDVQAVEELADLLELLHALTDLHGSSPEELESVRKRKADKRGGFRDRIFLLETEDAEK
ncbi:phosphoribosyl-ATP pyrophosphohydrolase [Paenibacillus chitinolyticus]|uniref:phosphoribosyl-ATP pyrophosphohydrolase n=1 Tax=Paenibacillus chitinolyticus TaxID=79263 RepID=UPI0036D96DAB